MSKILEYFQINENSRIPKYKQIVDSIIINISNGKFQMDDKITSINQLSEETNMSRDTGEKAYNILKEINVILPI